jgi:hypothetical protein
MSHSKEYDRNLASLLLQEVETQRNLMIAVATGGPRIDSVNSEYRERRERIHTALGKLGLQDPNPYADLWDWYGKWSTDLPGYVSRRQFISELYKPLQSQLRNAESGLQAGADREPTGWERVDRAVDKMRSQLATARHDGCSRTCSAREQTKPASICSTTARTSSSSARRYQPPKDPPGSRSASGCSRLDWSSLGSWTNGPNRRPWEPWSSR